MTASTERPGSGAPRGHQHAWALLQFELVGGHPVVSQRCESCGHVRHYRAWERYWTPPTASSGH